MKMMSKKLGMMMSAKRINFYDESSPSSPPVMTMMSKKKMGMVMSAKIINFYDESSPSSPPVMKMTSKKKMGMTVNGGDASAEHPAVIPATAIQAPTTKPTVMMTNRPTQAPNGGDAAAENH